MIMRDERTHKAKLNTLSTLINHLVATLCGIIVPRLMIGAFGSELYGATTSIAQFLSYIALLEGGIGRVARGALYSPLAQKDDGGISRIYHALKRFFRGIGVFFAVYAVVLAVIYYDIAEVEAISRKYTFWLVLAISFSTLVDYFFGITNMTLINADQHKYIVNLAVIGTRILNTLMIVVLISTSNELLTVKMVSSLVIIIRPLFYSRYVKKHYNLPQVEKKDAVLKHKWNGLGQHFAYFLHTNTDIVLLTLFADLATVSVYSVYSLIAVSIRNIASSFAGGMEAELGNIVAGRETKTLRNVYRRYQCMLNMIAMILFGTAAVMVMPFVRLYTEGIRDANYIQPAFALVLILAEGVNCISLPCSTIPISANKLKQTQWGAFGEAIVNIGVSCILMQWNPLLGVAMGTLCAEVFKSLYYIVYAEKNILGRPVWKALGRFGCSVLLLAAMSLGGMRLMMEVEFAGYIDWIVWAVVAVICVAIPTVLANLAMYRGEFRSAVDFVFGSIVRRLRRKGTQ